MVKPKFENIPVDLWVFPGKLGVARPSLCLFHNSVQLGMEILDALRELADAPRPARRTLTFKRCTRKKPLVRLRLTVVPEHEELKVMRIGYEAEAGTIEMTDDGLALVIDAVTSWLAGADDFGVSPAHSSLKRKEMGILDRESGELWFWGPRYYAP